jgi:histidinol-phosphate aminotransferase
MYKVSAKTNDVGIVSVPLTPTFEVRVPEVLAAVAANPRVKVIFICSPGNPTARLVPLDVVEKVLEGAPRCVVVVDEAYVDFADANSVSACRLLDKYPNLLVCQTLSKAFGLAGIRCGMAMGHPAVVQVLNNVKAPYNVSQLTSTMAHKAFEKENLAVLNKNVKDILKEKERVVEALQGLDVVKKIHPSDTNFILFEVPKAQEIYKDMAQAGVVARFRGNELHCKDCIRLTIGQPHENDSFLDLFKKTTTKYLGKYT